MKLLAWFHKRSSKRRDRKYAALDEVFAEAVATLAPGDIALDCGANVGAYTVRMAESGARVIAFEPNPDAFQELTRVTERFDNVERHNAAVTTEPGPVELYLHKWAEDDPLHWSASSSLLAEKSNVREDKSVTVEGIQFTDFVRGLGQPVKLLKMDVEGAEVGLLNQLLDEGLVDSIQQAFVETHDRRVRHLAEPTRRLKERLVEVGADQFRLDWR